MVQEKGKLRVHGQGEIEVERLDLLTLNPRSIEKILALGQENMELSRMERSLILLMSHIGLRKISPSELAKQFTSEYRDIFIKKLHQI